MARASSGVVCAPEIAPVIARTFSFDEAAQAHHYIQDRRNTGKVLLVP